jgi:hypothetical protein
MFIFFGTKERREQRGIVADYCPRCGGPRPFKVFDLFHVGHLYYIPLGRGSLSGSTTQCVDCGAEFGFDARRYPEVLPAAAAQQCSFDELIRRTNPGLLSQLGDPPPASGARPAPPAAAGTGPTRKCSTCGHVREAGHPFCPACGRRED